MKAWNGSKLLAEFRAMGTDRSNGVDAAELVTFLRPLNLGEWKQPELDELFAFLDVDGDGEISPQDFFKAMVRPMQKEQLERAIDAHKLGSQLANALPVPEITADGKLPNVLEEVAELSVQELERRLTTCLPAMAAGIHARLQPQREALHLARERGEQATGESKFTFEFADASQAEQGALNDRLGLPPPDVDQAMREEHSSRAEWTTGNCRLTTNPRLEFEFVDDPQEGKLYPGEGEDGRRRQDPEEAWRRVHRATPAAEALKSFRSQLGEHDAGLLADAVQRALGGHQTEEDRTVRVQGELREALIQALLPERERGQEAVCGRVSGSVLRKAASGRWMGEREKQEWVDRVLSREVRELEERLAGWDLTLAEVKAVIAYAGPLFEKYNTVLRRLETYTDAVPYKTTILMLVSAVMKMRMRTKLQEVGRRVFHGFRGGELPLGWMLEGEFGSKGGAEKGFLSTSLRWDQAGKYVAGGGNPVLLEMDLGQIDKGADIAELSQYPSEAEILFPPMTNLEVLGAPRLESIEGHTVVLLAVRANVSLRNETREELEAKRKAVFLPSLTNVLQETEHALDAIIACPPRCPALQECRFWAKETVLRNCRSVVAKYEAHAPEWFQVDQHYQTAVHEGASLKRRAVAKPQRVWQSQLSEEEWVASKGGWEAKLLSVVDAEVFE